MRGLKRWLVASVLAAFVSVVIVPGAQGQGLGSWVLEDSGTEQNLFEVHGNATELYAVGATSTHLAYDGSSWSSEAVVGSPTALASAVSVGPVGAFSGGADGVLRERGLVLGAPTWTQVTSPSTMDVNGIAQNDTTAWAVTDGGEFIERVSGTWATQQTIAGVGSPILRAIDHEAGLWVAVHQNGSVYQNTAGTWTWWTNLGDDHLRSVEVEGSEVWVGAEAGVVWHYDGSTWTSEQTTGNDFLLGITVLDDGVVVAVGIDGLITERSNLGLWRTAPAPTTGILLSVHSGPTGVHAVGNAGIITKRVQGSSSAGPTCSGLFFCDVRRYEIAHHQDSVVNPSTGTESSFSFTDDQAHSFQVGNYTLTVLIDHTVQVQETAEGVWRYRAFQNGSLIPDCTWYVGTHDSGGLFGEDGASGGPAHNIHCVIDNTDGPGTTHTISVSRDSFSGSPSSIELVRSDIQVWRQDAVDLETFQYRADFIDPDLSNLPTKDDLMDINIVSTEAEFWLYMTVFLAGLVWGGYTKQYWVLTGSFVGILSLFTPLGDWDTESVFILTLIGAVIGAFMRFFQARKERPVTEENMTRFT